MRFWRIIFTGANLSTLMFLASALLLARSYFAGVTLGYASSSRICTFEVNAGDAMLTSIDGSRFRRGWHYYEISRGSMNETVRVHAGRQRQCLLCEFVAVPVDYSGDIPGVVSDAHVRDCARRVAVEVVEPAAKSESGASVSRRN